MTYASHLPPNGFHGTDAVDFRVRRQDESSTFSGARSLFKEDWLWQLVLEVT